MKENYSGEKFLEVGENQVGIIQFDNLLKFKDRIKHCFSTRIGGVSTGEVYSLNLGFNRNDKRENVLENYKRVCESIGIQMEDIVLSNQIHDKKIRVVHEEDCGKGIFKESDIIGFDGLVTKEKGVALTTFYADCTPIYFYDPINNAIGLAHSGWKSTLRNIAKETVITMTSEFKTNPEDLQIVIGPHIGKCCFEVGFEVYEEFINTFDWCDSYCSKISEEKWLIDLEKIIVTNLIELGIKEANIYCSHFCTKCRNDIFFSHRGDKGKTGSLAAIMQLI